MSLVRNGRAIRQLLMRGVRISVSRWLRLSLYDHVFRIDAPASFLTNQGISSLIGWGNPSCLSITGARNVTILNGRENIEREGAIFRFMFSKSCALPLLF